jgi:TetR/AcrR family transcriptional regulator, transcriptional repressor for nem operon
MSTKDAIVKMGDELIRDKGFNAFSFYDISTELGIKNASIHYHFPTKTDLGVAVIKEHVSQLERLMENCRHKEPLAKLQAFLSIYTNTKSENRVCLVGSLATDLHTVDNKIKQELKILVARILDWVTEILEEGKTKNVFMFNATARTKALMIVTNMLAALQLTRLTEEKDFALIKKTIVNELKTCR